MRAVPSTAMGAIRLWHVVVLAICPLITIGAITAAMLLARRSRRAAERRAGGPGA